MNAEQIRWETADLTVNDLLRETTAQLADICENITALGLALTVIARVLATAEERFLK